MCSYKKEVLTDSADYNAVTIVMHSNKTDVAGGIQWVSDCHDELVEHFLQLRDEVYNKVNFPSFGDAIDRQIEAYVDGLGQFPIGGIFLHLRLMLSNSQGSGCVAMMTGALNVEGTLAKTASRYSARARLSLCETQ